MYQGFSDSDYYLPYFEHVSPVQQSRQIHPFCLSQEPCSQLMCFSLKVREFMIIYQYNVHFKIKEYVNEIWPYVLAAKYVAFITNLSGSVIAVRKHGQKSSVKTWNTDSIFTDITTVAVLNATNVLVFKFAFFPSCM